MDSQSNENRTLGATVDVREPESPGAVEAAEDVSGLSRRDIRRNMFFCVALDTIWITGWQDFQLALLPLLVYLKAPNKIIGLATGAVWITVFGLFLSPWITRRFHIKKWYLFVVNIPYMGALGFAGLAVVFSKQMGLSTETLLIVVVVSVLAHKFFEGFVGLPHQEYVAACIPATHRGRYSGLSVSLGSVVGVGSMAIGGAILYHLSKPAAFGYLFLMTWIICQSGYWFALLAKERPTPVEDSPKAWSKEMLLAFWQDKPYVRFLAVWAIPTISFGAVLNFMMVYGMEDLGMQAYTAATVGIVSLVVRSIIAAPSGVLVDRLGAKKILRLWPLPYASIYIILVLWHSPWAIYLCTVLSTIAGVTVSMAVAVLQYGLPKPENRAGHYTLQLMIQNVTVSIGVVASGFLLDAVTFRVAFIMAAVVALLFYPFLQWMIKPISDKITDYS